METIINEVIESDKIIVYETVIKLTSKDYLLQRKAEIESLINTPEPSTEELLEIGRMNHPYYQDKLCFQIELDEVITQLKKIDSRW